jgi:signal transduction histidine kinase
MIEEQLARQRDFLINSIDALTHPFYVIDVKDYRIVLANKSAWALHDGNALYCHEMTHRRTTPCDKESCVCPLQYVVKEKNPMQVMHIHHDQAGNPVFYEISAYPIFDAQGNVIQVIEYSQDITQRIEKEKEIQRLVYDLQVSNQELKRFNFILSHDLKEPLRMITTYLQLIEKKFQEKIDPMTLEYMEFVTQGINRINRQMQSLAKYSEIDHNQMSWENVSLDEVLTSVKNYQQQLIANAKAQIIHPPLPQVFGNRVLLLTLFEQLISNALQYNQDRENLQINISYQEEATEFIITISDNGTGIDPHSNEQVFAILQRQSAQGDYHTGMGLAMCRKIISLHQGLIRSENNPSGGTRFIFNLLKRPNS